MEAHWQWYGYQTLLPDAAAIGLFYAATRAHSPKTLLIASATTYLTGAPLVHFANGEWEKGAVSFALRIGVPLAFSAIPLGDALVSGKGHLCGDRCTFDQALLEVAAAVSALVGAGVAMIDDAVYAQRKVLVPKERTTEPSPPTSSPPRSQFITSLVPSVDIQKDRAGIGLRGTF